ncbi:MAG: hypothetical protein AABZ30_00340 [Myxococcota bacterium]
MKSWTTARFRSALESLPESVRQHAKQAYRLFRVNPAHPSLRFKRVHATKPLHSVRIGLGHRALGVREGDTIVWFWIGSHAEYDRLVAGR